MIKVYYRHYFDEIFTIERIAIHRESGNIIYKMIKLVDGEEKSCHCTADDNFFDGVSVIEIGVL